MPSAWSKKRERQYEHVKDSARERGRSAKRAKEIAARTVNKQRREAGETKQRRGSGSSSGGGGLEARSKHDLYERARELDIEGRSKMNKSQLVRAIHRHG